MKDTFTKSNNNNVHVKSEEAIVINTNAAAETITANTRSVFNTLTLKIDTENGQSYNVCMFH